MKVSRLKGQARKATRVQRQRRMIWRLWMMHDPDLVLGDRGKYSLSLKRDEIGLRYEITPAA